MQADGARPRRRSALVVGGLIALTSCASLFGSAGSISSGGQSPSSFAPIRLDLNDPRITRLIDNTLVPISPQKAAEVNAARPLDVTQLTPARPFVVPFELDHAARRADAVQCLTQAIYYEAAFEDDKGQRGVAQVVLNRVRHPLYPKTICGVVYQGAERATGCQFTFTCDGSLSRPPSARAWDRARRVAVAALAGRVEPGAGTATHYHANYVLPYWAGSLDKVATIGTHIFYSIRGALGRPAAFSGRYLLAAEAVPTGVDGPIVAVSELDGFSDTPLAAAEAATSVERSPWRADEISLTLPDAKGPALSQTGGAFPATRSLRVDEEIRHLIIDDRMGISLPPRS